VHWAVRIRIICVRIFVGDFRIFAGADLVGHRNFGHLRNDCHNFENCHIFEEKKKSPKTKIRTIVTKIVEIWKILCGDSFRFLLASNRFQGGVIWLSYLYRRFRYFVKFCCQNGDLEKNWPKFSGSILNGINQNWRWIFVHVSCFHIFSFVQKFRLMDKDFLLSVLHMNRLNG